MSAFGRDINHDYVLYHLSSSKPVNREDIDKRFSFNEVLGTGRSIRRIRSGPSKSKQKEVPSNCVHRTKCLYDFYEMEAHQKSVSKSVTINRNTLSKLFAFSVKYSQAIDFTKALCYPLSTVPFLFSPPWWYFTFKSEEWFQKYHLTLLHIWTKVYEQ